MHFLYQEKGLILHLHCVKYDDMPPTACTVKRFNTKYFANMKNQKIFLSFFNYLITSFTIVYFYYFFVPYYFYTSEFSLKNEKKSEKFLKDSLNYG